ncbi:MAG: hypothetical protein H6597_07425 [Flavobacteriales bacterium]|nr:hypothetical protein [Flavobacteriales bacterium]MCB9194350.1 hypothetical protein [Flavobacteriales bacterium]
MSRKSVPGFPQFRRSANGSNFYRIETMDRFVELQVIGRRVVRHDVHARVFPERQRIQDMLDGADGAFRSIPEEEFLAILDRWSE